MSDARPRHGNRRPEPPLRLQPATTAKTATDQPDPTPEPAADAVPPSIRLQVRGKPDGFHAAIVTLPDGGEQIFHSDAGPAVLVAARRWCDRHWPGIPIAEG